MKHFLSIEQLTRAEILDLLESAREYKATRGKSDSRTLQGQICALLFNKPSTRTRVSFEVGIREFDGAVIQNFAQNDGEKFARYSGLPTINALNDEQHPCQIIADLLTIFEKRGT